MAGCCVIAYHRRYDMASGFALQPELFAVE